jgi:multidrug efflux pump
VPVCVIAGFIALYALDFSINLLTLLALVLSIGLVVDDAIVVLENCQRRADLGETGLLAAFRGARQVGFAVMATTAVLVAVFLPIAFMQGNLGRLFRELAVAIAASVAISALVALSLSPMMCSKLLKKSAGHGGLAAIVDRYSARMTERYRATLERVLTWRSLFAALLVVTLISSFGLYKLVPTELAPAEDPEGAGFDYTLKQVDAVESRLLPLIDQGLLQRLNTRAPRGFGGQTTEDMHTAQAIGVMAPWNQRKVSTLEAMNTVRGLLNDLPGVQGFPQMRQGFGRGFGQPLQFVLLGSDYAKLRGWRDLLMAELVKNPKLIAPDSDYKETRPQLRVQVDKSRAADLGVSLNDIASTMDAMLGSRRITTYVQDGEEYDVIVQARPTDRASREDLLALTVRSNRGELVALRSVVKLQDLAEPGSLSRFNRLRAITISAGLAPGYSLGDAVKFTESAARRVLPAEALFDYKGDTRELRASGASVAITFLFALLVVYLVLAAQFESFLHPLVIMLTVPLAVFGALLGLWVFGSTLNLYSQIGIVILIGLAAKNGILIVEFANQLRDQGLSIREAVIEASCVRLRPIVMTSVATIAGALPLVFAHGAGAQSRITIGVVIVTGVAFSTVLSLFVVPSFYTIAAPYTRSPESLAQELEHHAATTTAAH